MEIIDISSSPEPPARARMSQNDAPRRLAKQSSIIEIADSDEDDDMLVHPSARKEKGKARDAFPLLSPRAGPSRRLNADLDDIKTNVPWLPPRAEQPAASRVGSQSKGKARTFPLFLPSGSDEENEPPVHVSPPVRANAPAVATQNPQPRPLTPQAASASPQPEERDPMDAFLRRILEVIPNVQPEHVQGLIRTHYLNNGAGVVDAVLNILFEDPSFPKVDRKGKRKQLEDANEEAEERNKRAKIDYSSTDREKTESIAYPLLSMHQLETDFAYIPRPFIKRAFARHRGLYAPTHLFLHAEQQEREPAFARKTTKARPRALPKNIVCEDFQKEREWVLERLRGEVAKAASAKDAEAEEVDMDAEGGGGIECGCCFSDYPFDKMIQCPDAHLFCTTCMTSYASTLLGSHDPDIKCMDQSGCKALFHPSELKRFLPPKLWDLYERVRARKDIEAAGLDGLEECPHCEFRCVIENAEEKLFRCLNEECMAITCRACKKPDHLPKSCKEVEEDKHLDGRHAIEEAMTKALMRNCPKCQQPFVKEFGCNKMTCPKCRSLSCYICRQLITGYDHFEGQGRPVASSSRRTGKCVLYDMGDQERRHQEEVAEARKKAMEKYKAEHPDADDKAVAVDLPERRTAPVGPHGQPLPAHGQPHLAHARAHALQYMGGLPLHMAVPPNYGHNPDIMAAQYDALIQQLAFGPEGRPDFQHHFLQAQQPVIHRRYPVGQPQLIRQPQVRQPQPARQPQVRPAPPPQQPYVAPPIAHPYMMQAMPMPAIPVFHPPPMPDHAHHVEQWRRGVAAVQAAAPVVARPAVRRRG